MPKTNHGERIAQIAEAIVSQSRVYAQIEQRPESWQTGARGQLHALLQATINQLLTAADEMATEEEYF